MNNPEELTSAIDRLKKQNQKIEHLKALHENLTTAKSQKNAIPASNGLIFLDISTIVYMKVEGFYAEIFCLDSSKHLVSRNLKNFEDIICFDPNFVRVPKSYIVNMEQIISYQKSEGGLLNLINGKQIPISSTKIETVLAHMEIIKR